MELRTVLVVGLRELSAGKTSLATALIRYLRETDLETCGFKPKAGNNLWYDYNVLQRSSRDGRVYGEDAKRLREASSCEFPEEVVNPVHRVWFETGEWGILGELPGFVVDRVALNGEGQLIVVNKPLLRRREYVAKYVERITHRSSEVVEVEEPDELRRLYKDMYEPSIERAYSHIRRASEVLVVESYSDIAVPWEGLEGIDLVLGVEPWRVVVYDAEKYMAAFRLYSEFRHELELTTSQVCRALRPKAELLVEPATREEIAESYRPVLERILGGLV